VNQTDLVKLAFILPLTGAGLGGWRAYEKSKDEEDEDERTRQITRGTTYGAGMGLGASLGGHTAGSTARIVNAVLDNIRDKDGQPYAKGFSQPAQLAMWLAGAGAGAYGSSRLMRRIEKTLQEV